MNTENILTCAGEIAAHLKNGELDSIGQTALENLICELKEQMRLESVAAPSERNAVKIITGMLKKLRKQDNRTALHYAWIDKNGRQCVCDGVRAFRLTDHLALEDRPADAGAPLDLDKVFPDITSAQYYSLPLPEIGQLKTHIALERGKNGRSHTPMWDFGDDAPTVNAQFLSDLLSVLPDAREVFIRRGAAGIGAPMYAKGVHGDALLVPVHCPRFTEKTKAAERREAEQNASENDDKTRQKTLVSLLKQYQDELKNNPKHALSLDDFANLASYAYQIAV